MLALLVLLSLLLTETDLCKKKKKCSILGQDIGSSSCTIRKLTIFYTAGKLAYELRVVCTSDHSNITKISPFYHD